MRNGKTINGWHAALIFGAAIFPAASGNAIETRLGRPPDMSRSCKINVGDDVQVSREEYSVKETFIAVNPNDANNLIATGFSHLDGDPNHDYYLVVYSTKDGGKSWSKPQPLRATNGDPIAAGKAPAADPTVWFDGSGGAFLVTYYAPVNLIYRSRDGGQSFDTPEIFADRLDHPMPAIDMGPGRFSGNMYLFGLVFEKGHALHLLRSRDGGVDWSTHHIVSNTDLKGPEYKYGLNSANNGLLIDQTGKLFLYFVAWISDKKISSVDRWSNWMVESDDAGQTFSAPRLVSRQDGAELIADENALAGIPAAFALDSSDSQFRGRHYSAWVSKKSHELMFSVSGDQGRTWVPPVSLATKISTRRDPGHFKNAYPIITVNKNGVVFISYYKFDYGKAEKTVGGSEYRTLAYRRFVQASVDGGKTFLREVPLAKQRTKFSIASFTFDGGIAFDKAVRNASADLDDEKGNAVRGIKLLDRLREKDPHFDVYNFGDYLNTVSDRRGKLRAEWMDGRSGTQQIWYNSAEVICGQGVAKAG